MTAQPRILVLRSPGTNCDLETAHAFASAGGRPDRVHVNRLLENPSLLHEYQILCLAGGFSYGDDLAAGRVLAQQIRYGLLDELSLFRDQGNCILGICNGFQVLLQTGLLIPENFGSSATATLTLNASGRYEDRWVRLQVTTDHCVFLQGLTTLYLPVAHAEGRFVVRERSLLERLFAKGCVALTYCERDTSACSNLGSEMTAVVGELGFPANPNGSMGNVAGLTDSTGRVLGLMPHPERFIHRTQHPRWTRHELPEIGDGLAVFQNVVRFFQDQPVSA